MTGSLVTGRGSQSNDRRGSYLYIVKKGLTVEDVEVLALAAYSAEDS